MEDVGRLLILLGAAVILVGLLFLLAGRIPFLGHLPGDVVIRTDGATCFIPIATSILLSILLSLLLTLVLNLLQRR